MEREELGLRLQQWHTSMNDPVYAVGSFYFAGQRYPDKLIVEKALSNLTKDLHQFKQMLAGEKVMVVRQGTQVDYKKFAGFTDAQVEEMIANLEEITSELQRFMRKDYIKTFTEEEVKEKTNVPGGTLEHDNQGQLLIYTGIYRWSDDTYHDVPEEEEPNA